MSGIYILKTRGEYRVAYSTRLNEMLNGYTDTFRYNYNTTVVDDVFGANKPFTKSEEAYTYAMTLTGMYPETDDGIYMMNDWEHLDYKELINGQNS